MTFSTLANECIAKWNVVVLYCTPSREIYSIAEAVFVRRPTVHVVPSRVPVFRVGLSQGLVSCN